MKAERVLKALGDRGFVAWTQRVAGKVHLDLSGADMYNRNLSHANMEGANMEGANMRGAVLRGSNMSYANMGYANMKCVNMRGAVLRGSNMSYANMSYADMEGADMEGADMRDVFASYAGMVDVDLRGADMSRTKMDFASWPLWCGSVGAKVDDRIASQLLWHVGKLDTEHCSQMMKDAIEHVRQMAASDVFSDEYRTGLDGQEV